MGLPTRASTCPHQVHRPTLLRCNSRRPRGDSHPVHRCTLVRCDSPPRGGAPCDRYAGGRCAGEWCTTHHSPVYRAGATPSGRPCQGQKGKVTLRASAGLGHTLGAGRGVNPLAWPCERDSAIDLRVQVCIAAMSALNRFSRPTSGCVPSHPHTVHRPAGCALRQQQSNLRLSHARQPMCVLS